MRKLQEEKLKQLREQSLSAPQAQASQKYVGLVTCSAQLGLFQFKWWGGKQFRFFLGGGVLKKDNGIQKKKYFLRRNSNISYRPFPPCNRWVAREFILFYPFSSFLHAAIEENVKQNSDI